MLPDGGKSTVQRHLVRVLASIVILLANVSALACGDPTAELLEGLATRVASDEQTPLSYEAELCVNEARIRVLVADTPQERAAGLSGYAGLPEDAGMLFVFPEPRQPSFWMKGMKFAIDIIWIADGTVVQIDASVSPPPPDTPDRPTAALPARRTNHPRARTNRRFCGTPRHRHRQPHRALHRGNVNAAPCGSDRANAFAALNRAILQRATTSIWIELRARTPMAYECDTRRTLSMTLYPANPDTVAASCAFL